MKESDDQLRNLFLTDSRFADDLYVVRWDSSEELKPTQDDWSRYFYGHFDFKYVGRPKKLRCTRVFTPTFVGTNYLGVGKPKYSNSQVGWDGQDLEEYLSACAVNYLIKNSWHNFVHVRLQGQNHENYLNFQGLARRQIDAEADHLATVLLVMSYGLPISLDGWTSPNEDIVRVLRRNRCNDIFKVRAEVRGQKSTPEEAEERYCRALLNYLSGWLIARGLCPHTINVYLGPRRLQRPGFERKLNSEQVLIDLNGYRIDTGLGWKSNPSIGNPAPSQRDHFREIAENVQTKYLEHLNADRLARGYVRSSLSARFRSMEIPLDFG